MNNGEMFIGITVPVFPSSAIINEYLRNGWTESDIEKMLSNDPWIPPIPSGPMLAHFARLGVSQVEIDEVVSAMKKNCADLDMTTESPLEEYKEAVGYMFNWGHVVQSYLGPDEETPTHFFTWDFSLDTILSLANESGLHLGELSDLCIDYLADERKKSRSNKKLRSRSWPVEIHDGMSNASCFGFYFQTEEELMTATEQFEYVRKWIATEFIEQILPPMMSFLKSKFANVGIENE